MGTREGVFYRPELDCLRLVAFFAVFMHHALPSVVHARGAPSFIVSLYMGVQRSGAYGVDLFFVLSAYLITELLRREIIRNGELDVAAFWYRRVLRIWPLYFVFLSICVLLSALRILHQHFAPDYLVAFVLLGGNWICAFKGFPASAAAPLWSISLEEQFYLGWPLVMRFLGIRRLVYAAITLIVVAFVSRWYFLRLHLSHPAVWCSTLTRLDPIACGALLAAWLDGNRPVLSRASRITMALAAVCVWLAITWWAPLNETNATSLFVGYPAVALSSSVLVAVALASDVSQIPLWVLRAWTYLGKVSYGLYVFHLLCIRIFERSVNNPLTQFSCAFAATVFLSVVSFHYIERPFLRLKLRYTHVLSR